MVKDEVVPRAAVLEIVPGSAEDCVATAEPSQHIVAASASELLVTGCTEQGLARGRAEDQRRSAQNEGAVGATQTADGDRVRRASDRVCKRHPA